MKFSWTANSITCIFSCVMLSKKFFSTQHHKWMSNSVCLFFFLDKRKLSQYARFWKLTCRVAKTGTSCWAVVCCGCCGTQTKAGWAVWGICRIICRTTSWPGICGCTTEYTAGRHISRLTITGRGCGWICGKYFS
jgi:hypothetical protein